MKETDLAATVLQFLSGDGWETWQEVTLPDGGRADIVARLRPLVWVIETKTSLSLDLIEQAFARTHYAHLVSVAVPQAREPRHFARSLLAHEGVGLLEVRQDRWADGMRVQQTRRANLHRRATTRWTKDLCDEHRTALAAGSQAGGQWTPFRETCRRAADHVRHRPGCTLRELFDSIDHHYHSAMTARGAFAKRIEEGLVPGLEIRRDGRRLTVWPSQPLATASAPVDLPTGKETARGGLRVLGGKDSKDGGPT